MRAANQGVLGSSPFAPSSGSTSDKLPPSMKYKRREGKQHLKPEHMEEMRRLRAEDPVKWSVNALARKFDCSDIIVRVAAPPPAGHKEWLQQRQERRESRWGPMKTKAREDRKARTDMMYRGEI